LQISSRSLPESTSFRRPFIYEFPVAVSPLSKQKPDEPGWVERFEFYIGGFELGNAFSELNDPEEQFRRFQEQLAQHERGDEEAQPDGRRLRCGRLAVRAAPTAGEGIGIDRLDDDPDRGAVDSGCDPVPAVEAAGEGAGSRKAGSRKRANSRLPVAGGRCEAVDEWPGRGRLSAIFRRSRDGSFLSPFKKSF